MTLRDYGRILFSGFIAAVMTGALLVAKDWPIRASIIVLLLGGLGVVLALIQLALDIKRAGLAESAEPRPAFEVAAVEHQGRWGTLEIWAWLAGLFLAIHVIGFPLALPLFVFLYIRTYGGGWIPAVLLGVGTWGFLYGVFAQVLSVVWPKPWLWLLFGKVFG
ncbi:MAG TPA: tripartite tricarboxylate transporter TctB family protein [Candidatus Binatia bacterium]|nr:tripartite tricarboxylate transporter TctB family protein [Candidatus Binatia bacterium]